MSSILFALLLVNYARSQVYQLPFDGTWIDIAIGTPEQGFSAQFKIHTDKILVSDKGCGERKIGCPAYCYTNRFFAAYCHPLCKSDLGPGTELLYCYYIETRYSYNHTASSTFIDTGHEWKEWSVEYLPYFVRSARDTFAFKKGHSSTLTVPNAMFGRILLGDAR
jgi:hypothetical protein